MSDAVACVQEKRLKYKKLINYTSFRYSGKQIYSRRVEVIIKGRNCKDLAFKNVADFAERIRLSPITPFHNFVRCGI
jgi:hypothetical protein